MLFFLVFTLIFTLFENVIIAGISLLLVGTALTIYQLISHKKILTKKTLVFVFLAFALAAGAFWIKEWRYYGTMERWNNGTMATINNKKTFTGTWIISDLSNKWKYTFSAQEAEYLLYSKKEYAIGDHIRLVGNLQKNIHSDWFSYREIDPSTFKIPLFSWSFDYPKRLKMKWRKGTIYETNSLSITDGIDGLDRIDGIESSPPNPSQNQSNPSLWIIKSMKKWIQEKVIQAYGKNKISWLILGMLIGDKSQIPESEYQFFINSWLVHLIAVSGGNILMIVVFLQCVLFFLPFYARLGLILFTIIGYSLICGMDSSVFRAVLMWGMSMVALFRWREIPIWRLLSMSCIIMLIINPYFLAYDVGFLLSYSALFGLIYFQTKIRDEGIGTRDKEQEPSTKPQVPYPIFWIQKILQYIYKNYISPSIGASIGIFPIIIFFMGKINLLGVIGNLFVLPIVPFVMIYGFISIRIYQIFGRQRLLWIEKILIQYIYKISELLSAFGLYISVTWLRCKYAFLVVCLVGFVWWRFRKEKTD